MTFEDIADLFEDDDEVIEEESDDEGFEARPAAYIALPGANVIRVPVNEGMTVAQALDMADVTLRATDQTVWLDGQPVGLDTVVTVGSTITATGRAKGG